jgi:hypothetical protein
MAELSKKAYDPRNIGHAKNVSDVKRHLTEAKKIHQTIVVPVSQIGKKFLFIKQSSKDLMDEYKRPGTVASLTFEAMKAAIEKIVGSIGSHPFLKYHEFHFKLLFDTINAISAGQRVNQNMDAAYQIAERIKNESFSCLKPYRDDQEKFNDFKSSMSSVFVGAALLRVMVEQDVNNKSLSESTIKGWIDVTRAACNVHKRAQSVINEVFEIYVSLHQSLSLVIMLTNLAQKDRNKMQKSGGTIKNLSTIQENVIKIKLQVMGSGSGLDAENLDEPIRAAIQEVEDIINIWIKEDGKFSNDLFKLDVYAAFRQKDL